MTDHLAGWCCGYRRNPHYVDQLITSNAPVPLCTTCHTTWLRTDAEADR